MDTHSNNKKEELLIRAIKTQYSILKLLDTTLLETFLYEKGLPDKEQNEDVIHLAYRIRSIIAKKPKLKEIYRQLEEEFNIHLSE